MLIHNLIMKTSSRQSEYGNTYLTPDEVATLIRVSKQTIYRMTDKREIVFYRLKGAIRFLREDVERFMDNCRVKSVNEYEYDSKTKT